MYSPVSSGKISRINTCYPESFRFLGLWGEDELSTWITFHVAAEFPWSNHFSRSRSVFWAMFDPSVEEAVDEAPTILSEPRLTPSFTNSLWGWRESFWQKVLLKTSIKIWFLLIELKSKLETRPSFQHLELSKLYFYTWVFFPGCLVSGRGELSLLKIELQLKETSNCIVCIVLCGQSEPSFVVLHWKYWSVGKETHWTRSQLIYRAFYWPLPSLQEHVTFIQHQ